MTPSTSTKNGGSAEAMLAKAPWTDEQGIGVKIYEGLVMALDVIMLLIKMNITWAYCIYRFFVPPEPKNVRDEIVLITGAGHGMGREMSLQFASLGSIIVCVDINPAGCKETVDLIKNNNGRAHQYECDVTDLNAIKELQKRVKQEVGDVTILVNNAGIMPCKSFLTHSEKEIRTMFDVNVLAHFWLLQAFLPSMMEKNHGHVVAMSSMAGLVGLRNLVPYCASKFAVRGMMEALHEELREDPKDYSGVKFTAIFPFIVDTGLCKKPKIKFPSMLPIVTPQSAATNIIDAVRRNYSEITIPSSLYYTNQYLRALPRDVPLHLKDFLDSGVEADA